MSIRGTHLVLAVMGLLQCTRAEAVNRFRIVGQSFPVDSLQNAVPVLADLDQDILGFSVSLDFDSTKLQVPEVRLGEDVLPLEPDFVDSRIDNTSGSLVTGVVFALQVENLETRLASGSSREVLEVVIDVVTSSESTTVLNLNNVSGHPGRLNVMTNEGGESVSPPPMLVDGQITLFSSAPDIQDLQFNEGEAGDEFFVVGRNFDLPGLSVRVCGSSATFRLLVDNQTVGVIAPDCPREGFAELEVCNDFGCDSEPNGFDYITPPSLVPVIQDIQFNRGGAGAQFVVVGLNMDRPNTRVLVCGAPASFTALNSQTLQVVAPPCPSAGFAELQVCNDDGCATEANGFEYEEIVGTTFLRGDANDDGAVDLSDGVAILNDLFIGIDARAPCDDALDANDTGQIDLSDGIHVLNFLFQGGPSPPAPFPDPGEDPTADSLAGC